VADRLLARGIVVGIIDLFDLARFSEENLRKELQRYETVVSMEEGFAGRGGLDALLYNFIAHNEIAAKLFNIGVEGGYRVELGTRAELHEQVGIGPDVVTRRLVNLSNLNGKRAEPFQKNSSSIRRLSKCQTEGNSNRRRKMSKLKNKVAIVTGASKGIGAGIAKALAAQGAAVVVHQVDVELALLVARLLHPHGIDPAHDREGGAGRRHASAAIC